MAYYIISHHWITCHPLYMIKQPVIYLTWLLYSLYTLPVLYNPLKIVYLYTLNNQWPALFFSHLFDIPRKPPQLLRTGLRALIVGSAHGGWEFFRVVASFSRRNLEDIIKQGAATHRIMGRTAYLPIYEWLMFMVNVWCLFSRSNSRWWFQTFPIFTPKIGKDEPILTHIF